MTHSITIDARFVAEHETFLRRLGRSLVGDGADDAVQDAWLGALEAPPRRDPRGYLVTVLRNRALRLRGRERARGAIEAAAARGERLEDVVERRLAVQEELARALRALPDAQRTALYLRFHEDLTPTEIAARAGESLATVKSRLSRGLAALRAELDARSNGDQREWLTALAPITTGATRRWCGLSRTAQVGGLATVTALVLVGLAARTWRLTESPSGRAAVAGLPAAAAGGATASESAPSSPALRAGSAVHRAQPSLAESRTAQQSAVASAEEIGSCAVSFELVDATGAPIVGAEASFTNEALRNDSAFETFGYVVDPMPATVTAITDSEGRARVTLASHPLIDWSLEVRAEGYGRALHDLDSIELGVDVDLGRLVVAPAATIVATILHSDGSAAPPELRAWLRLEALAASDQPTVEFHQYLPLQAGVAVFDGLPAGRYSVSRHASIPLAPARREVVVAAGETAEVTLVLSEAPLLDVVWASAEGRYRTRPPVGALRLFTANGVPVAPAPRASVVPSDHWAVSEAGPFVVEFDAPGWRPVRREDVQRGEFARLQVEPLSGVRLFVEDATGAPIASGVRVGRLKEYGPGRAGGTVLHAEPMHWHRAPLASGTFFALPPGSERLRLGGPWWHEVEVSVAALTLGEVRDVHVLLEPARRIRGRIVDDFGASVPFARVQLLELAAVSDGASSPIAMPKASNFERADVRRERDFLYANASGRFELGCEIGGALLVRAWHPDAASAPWPVGAAHSSHARRLDTQRLQGAEFAVPANRGIGGEVFDIELDLTRRVTVAGRLTTWTPTTGGFDLVLTPLHGAGPAGPFSIERSAACTPDTEGRFSFDRLAPGPYRLHARVGVQPYERMTLMRATPFVAEFEVPVMGLADLEVTPNCALPEWVPFDVQCVGELHGPLVVSAVEIDASGDVDPASKRWARIDPGQSARIPLEPRGLWRLTVFDERDHWALEQEVRRDEPCASIPIRLDLATGTVRLVDHLGAPVPEEMLVPIPAGRDFLEGRYHFTRLSNLEGILELCLPRGDVELSATKWPNRVPVARGALSWPPPPGTTIVMPGS